MPQYISRINCPSCKAEFKLFDYLQWLGYYNGKDKYKCSECGSRFTVHEWTGEVKVVPRLLS